MKAFINIIFSPLINDVYMAIKIIYFICIVISIEAFRFIQNQCWIDFDRWFSIYVTRTENIVKIIFIRNLVCVILLKIWVGYYICFIFYKYVFISLDY